MFKYKTGSYVIISHDGVPSLLGKVKRKRGHKAEIVIINGCWSATFDEIGIHHTPTGGLYLVEAEIELTQEIRNGLAISVGTEVMPYVDKAIALFVGPDEESEVSSFDEAVKTMRQTDEYKEAIRFSGDKAQLRGAFYEVAQSFYQLGKKSK